MRKNLVCFALAVVMVAGALVSTVEVYSSDLPFYHHFTTINESGSFLVTTSEIEYLETRLNRRYVVYSINDNDHFRLQGIRDIDGNVVVPPIYQSISFGISFHGPPHPFLSAKLEGKYGMIDLRGSVVVPFISDSPVQHAYLGTSPADHLFTFTQYERNEHGIFSHSGVINIRGEIVVDPMTAYRRINHVGNGFFSAFYDNFREIILLDSSGNRVLELEAGMNILAVHDNFVIVSDSNGVGLIENFTGRPVLPLIYGELRFLGNNYVAYRYGELRNNFIVSLEAIAEDRWGSINIMQNRISMLPNYSFNEVRAVKALRRSPIELIIGNFVNATRIHWFNELRDVLGNREMMILCLNSGQVARATSFSNGNHADINGVTPEDHEMLASFSSVIVRVGDTITPAAMSRFYPSNHFCLHFYGSTQNNGRGGWGNSHIEFGERVSRIILNYAW